MLWAVVASYLREADVYGTDAVPLVVLLAVTQVLAAPGHLAGQ
jgi:hypothetical protein